MEGDDVGCMVSGTSEMDGVGVGVGVCEEDG